MSSTAEVRSATRRTGLIVGVAVASPFAVVMALMSLADKEPEPFTLGLGIASLVAGATVGWLFGPSASWAPGRVPWGVVVAACIVAVVVGAYMTGGVFE